MHPIAMKSNEKFISMDKLMHICMHHIPGPGCSKGFLLTCTAGQCTPSVNQSDPEDTKIIENSGQERKT